MGRTKETKEYSNTTRKRGSDQLGISIGTARNTLVKKIMFKLIKETNNDICYRCNKKIEDIKELSIEHKIDWLYSKNPLEIYLDLDNITFSHLKCNISFKRKSIKLPGKVSNTGFRGVSKRSTNGKYRAMIRINRKTISIGDYNTPQEAATAYDEKAIELFGVDAITNKNLGLM